MNRKKVSIIIIAYNVEPFFVQCLDSVLNQTLDDIEIIIVESSSSDRTGIIADEYAIKNPGKMRVIHTPKKGLGHARNTGLMTATGDYIGFVDSDDWVERDMFEVLYNEAKSSKADLVTCNYQTYLYINKNNTNLFNLRGLKTLLSASVRRGVVYRGFEDLGYRDERSNSIMSGTTAVWNKLFRRELVEGRSFFEDIVPEDYDFTISSIVEAKKISHVDSVLYHYRVWENSTLGDMKFFKQDPYQLFETIARTREKFLLKTPELISAFDDRAVLGLFNWNIDNIHAIKDGNVRRAYGLKWSQLLNITLPEWYDKDVIKNWTVGVKALEELVSCYRTEQIDDRYDALVQKISSPPYSVTITVLRSLRKMVRL